MENLWNRALKGLQIVKYMLNYISCICKDFLYTLYIFIIIILHLLDQLVISNTK